MLYAKKAREMIQRMKRITFAAREKMGRRLLRAYRRVVRRRLMRVRKQVIRSCTENVSFSMLQ